jgi:hypothetical protein
VVGAVILCVCVEDLVIQAPKMEDLKMLLSCSDSIRYQMPGLQGGCIIDHGIAMIRQGPRRVRRPWNGLQEYGRKQWSRGSLHAQQFGFVRDSFIKSVDEEEGCGEVERVSLGPAVASVLSPPSVLVLLSAGK